MRASPEIVMKVVLESTKYLDAFKSSTSLAESCNRTVLVLREVTFCGSVSGKDTVSLMFDMFCTP